METDKKVIEYLLAENKRLQGLLDHRVFNVQPNEDDYLFHYISCTEKSFLEFRMQS